MTKRLLSYLQALMLVIESPNSCCREEGISGTCGPPSPSEFLQARESTKVERKRHIHMIEPVDILKGRCKRICEAIQMLAQFYQRDGGEKEGSCSMNKYRNSVILASLSSLSLTCPFFRMPAAPNIISLSLSLSLSLYVCVCVCARGRVWENFHVHLESSL